uniref:Uncharacterized protein n=1 Tax=Anguilla anguilla TaxID=7936 RepID=A0A0E9W5X7_ANGAN
MLVKVKQNYVDIKDDNLCLCLNPLKGHYLCCN